MFPVTTGLEASPVLLDTAYQWDPPLFDLAAYSSVFSLAEKRRGQWKHWRSLCWTEKGKQSCSRPSPYSPGLLKPTEARRLRSSPVSFSLFFKLHLVPTIILSLLLLAVAAIYFIKMNKSLINQAILNIFQSAGSDWVKLFCKASICLRCAMFEKCTWTCVQLSQLIETLVILTILFPISFCDLHCLCCLTSNAMKAYITVPIVTAYSKS